MEAIEKYHELESIDGADIYEGRFGFDEQPEYVEYLGNIAQTKYALQYAGQLAEHICYYYESNEMTLTAVIQIIKYTAKCGKS